MADLISDRSLAWNFIHALYDADIVLHVALDSFQFFLAILIRSKGDRKRERGL